MFGLKNNQEGLKLILFTTFFFYGTGIMKYNTSDLSLVVISLIGVLYYVKFNKRPDHIFLFIIGYVVILNVSSIFILGGGHFNFTTFVGSILKLFIPYTFIRIGDKKFVHLYLGLVYKLAIISIPFFALQLLNSSLFNYIPLNLVESNRESFGHVNFLIFNFNSFHPLRNSGFAGEPGTFGYYIGLAIIFNLMLNKGKFNKQLLILFIVGLTTLSTTFYLSLILIFFYYSFNIKGKFVAKSVFFLGILLSSFYIYKLDFIGNKLFEYTESTQKYVENVEDTDGGTKVNRFSAFIVDFVNVSKYPIGYGVNEGGKVRTKEGKLVWGTNGLSDIAVKFGILGFIIYVSGFFSLFSRLGRQAGLKFNGLAAIVILLYVFSNPMERDIYAMGLFWIFITKQKMELNESSLVH